MIGAATRPKHCQGYRSTADANPSCHATQLALEAMRPFWYKGQGYMPHLLVSCRADPIQYTLHNLTVERLGRFLLNAATTPALLQQFPKSMLPGQMYRQTLRQGQLMGPNSLATRTNR